MNEVTDLPNLEHILDFWFHPETKPFWFQPTPQFDQKVKILLGSAHQAAASSQLEHWKETPKGCLALVILLDQVPRNIFRNTPQDICRAPAGALQISFYTFLMNMLKMRQFSNILSLCFGKT